MLVYPKPRLPITGAGMSQPSGGPPSPQGTPQAPGVGPVAPPTTNTGMQQNQGGMPRQAQQPPAPAPVPGAGGPPMGSAPQAQPPNPLLGRAAMAPEGQNYSSGSGQWGRVTDRHPGGYVGAGSGTWEQSYKQQQPVGEQLYNRLGARPEDVKEGKPGANVAVGALSENMANASKYALAPGVTGQGTPTAPDTSTQTADVAPMAPPPGGGGGAPANPGNNKQQKGGNQKSGDQGDNGGVGTSSSGLTNSQGRNSFHNGENGLADPYGAGDQYTNTRTAGDGSGRIIAKGADGRDYAYDRETQTWTEYTNVKDTNPDTGIPYSGALMNDWTKNHQNEDIQPGKIVDYSGPGGGHYRYDGKDANGNDNWTPVDQDGRPLNGPQGTPQGGTQAGPGQQGNRPATGYPEGYTTDGYAVYDQNGMRLSEDERNAAKGQMKTDEMLKGVGEGIPEMSREGLNAQTKANDASFAAKSADAMRAALVASARGGSSPEFQSGQLADVAQKGGLAGAQANAQAQLQYDVQNFQAQIHGYDAKLQALEQAAQFAHDDASQQRIIALQKQLLAMKNDAEMKMAQYKAQLNTPGAGDYLLGGLGMFGSLLGGIL